jgi:hypothetical protein
MVEKLPLALVEQEAKSAVSAERGKQERDPEGDGQPARADGDGFGSGLRLMALTRFLRHNIRGVHSSPGLKSETRGNTADA